MCWAGGPKGAFCRCCLGEKKKSLELLWKCRARKCRNGKKKVALEVIPIENLDCVLVLSLLLSTSDLRDIRCKREE